MKALLEEEGFVVIRAAGSLGVCDLVALRRNNYDDADAMLIEVKSDAKYPYQNFGPAKRAAIEHAAEEAGAEAWLCWWPPRKHAPSWVPSSEWPEVKAAA